MPRCCAILGSCQRLRACNTPDVYAAACPQQVFVLVGPAGAGRSTLAQLLLSDFPSKLVPVPLLTSRYACFSCVTKGLAEVVSLLRLPGVEAVLPHRHRLGGS